MKKVMIGLIVLAFLASARMVSAQGADNILSAAADESIAFTIHNDHATDSWSMVVSPSALSQTNTVTIGGHANTVIIMAETGSVSWTANLIGACTNATSDTDFSVDQDSSLAADVAGGNLLAGTYTAAAGNTVAVLWDTSECLHSDIYIPDRGNQKSRGNLDVVNINSVPTGTGNVTAKVYIDRTLKWQKVVVSPVYVYSAGLASTNNMVVDAVVNINEAIKIPVKGSQSAFVRIERATTMTTPSIAVTVE